MSEANSTAVNLPAAVVAPRRTSLWPWVLPLLALVAAGVLGWQAWSQRGPLVTVEFAEGSGIGVGDPVSYRGMRVGEVKAVRLSPDLSRVAVDARLRRDAAGLAAEGSQWWIVRPEISAGRVSGLDALLGPRYLEVHPGKGPRTVQFTGLDRPPGGGHDPQSAATGGLELVIDAPQRGSLAVDSPVVYRGIKVGSVRAMRLASKAQSIEVVIVIDGEFRSLVRANSRFWNAGGIGVDWGLIRGLQVRAGSFEALVAGAIAFATPTKPGDPVENGHRFPLADEPKDDWLTWAPPIELGK